MSQYPNAAKGLKMMFWAEIISIACVVLLIIPFVNLLAAIAVIAASIVSMVGLYKAGNDAPGYRTAFWLTVLQLVVNLFKNADGIFGGVISIVGAIVALAIVYYVCITTAELLTSIGNQEIAEQGNIWKTYLVCTVVEIVCVLVSWIPVVNILAVIAALVSAIAMLVAGIMYLIFLYKSYQALEA